MQTPWSPQERPGKGLPTYYSGFAAEVCDILQLEMLRTIFETQDSGRAVPDGPEGGESGEAEARCSCLQALQADRDQVSIVPCQDRHLCRLFIGIIIIATLNYCAPK